MFHFSKKVEYGITSLLHLHCVGAEERVPTRELADAYRIPVEHLGKVLQRMVRAGLIESTQGAHGGYSLSRALSEITLAEVVGALDSPKDNPVEPVSSRPCASLCTCFVKKGVRAMEGLMQAELERITLDMVLEQHSPAPETEEVSA